MTNPPGSSLLNRLMEFFDETHELSKIDAPILADSRCYRVGHHGAALVNEDFGIKHFSSPVSFSNPKAFAYSSNGQRNNQFSGNQSFQQLCSNTANNDNSVNADEQRFSSQYAYSDNQHNLQGFTELSTKPYVMLYYVASAIKGLQFHVDDDIMDKLNYYYTSSIITIFAILVSAKQYVGQPIQCWVSFNTGISIVPATFTDPMEQYTENYCWVQNTYWLPLHSYIPQSIAEREDRQIGYYQWVPFVLALEALLFYVPCIVWRLLNWQSGIHVQSLVQMACDSRLLDASSRDKAIKTIASHVEDALHIRNQMNASAKFRCLNFLVCSRSSGSSVTCLYMCTKTLYALNVVGQIFLLNSFLGSRSTFYGFHVLNDLLHGREWTESGNFPRVTMCDFEVKVLGNVHRHTVQCVLMINMFNEKIFLFLWFWYFLLGFASFSSLLYWIFISVVAGRRIGFVGKYLQGIEGYKMVDQPSLRRFVLTFLKYDGVFLLRMTATHAGELVCCELAKQLWNDFIDSKDKRSDV